MAQRPKIIAAKPTTPASAPASPPAVDPAAADAYVFGGPGQDVLEKAVRKATAEKTVPLNMRVSESFHEELRTLAFQRKIPMAQIIREGVELWKRENT